MNSPSASSVTLSLGPVDDDVSMGNYDIPVPQAFTLPRNEAFSSPRSTASYENEAVSFIDGFSPSMRAASTADPQRLRAVLSRESSSLANTLREAGKRQFQDSFRLHFLNPCAVRNELVLPSLPRDCLLEIKGEKTDVYRYGRDGITSALLEAVRAGLVENVRVLLEMVVNADGVPVEHILDAYAAFFLRFRPKIERNVDQSGDVASRKELLDYMDRHQLSPLTVDEAEDRFCGMAPFWCEEGFTEASFFPGGEAMPSLVEAARCSDIEIFDILMRGGADASFWLSPQTSIPEPPTASSLSISSPLHAALQASDTNILEHLLNIGFDPNTLPLSNPTRAITPLMGTIIYHTHFLSHAFDILSSHRLTNLNLRTPVYKIHILHFAVAVLNLNTLKEVAFKIPLENAGITAIGHTLLHIACLPASAIEVERHSELIYRSIHETRDLCAWNDDFASEPSRVPPPPSSGSSLEDLEEEWTSQTEVVQYLWDNGFGLEELKKTDLHGNTPLHYLVSCREVNEPLLEWWLDQEGVSEVYEKKENRWGYTASELYYDNKLAQREPRGWKLWFDNVEKEERNKRKEEVWKELFAKKKEELWREMLAKERAVGA